MSEHTEIYLFGVCRRIRIMLVHSLETTAGPTTKAHHNIFLSPYFGPKKNMMVRADAITTLPNAKKPGARKRCLKPTMVVTDAC
jgi:hypothetical protein